MPEARLLALVRRYPHPAALAHRVDAAVLFAGLRRLERAGLVFRRGGVYRLTRRGRGELELVQALGVAVARGLAA